MMTKAEAAEIVLKGRTVPVLLDCPDCDGRGGWMGEYNSNFTACTTCKGRAVITNPKILEAYKIVGLEPDSVITDALHGVARR